MRKKERKDRKKYVEKKAATAARLCLDRAVAHCRVVSPSGLTTASFCLSAYCTYYVCYRYTYKVYYNSNSTLS